MEINLKAEGLFYYKIEKNLNSITLQGHFINNFDHDMDYGPEVCFKKDSNELVGNYKVCWIQDNNSNAITTNLEIKKGSYNKEFYFKWGTDKVNFIGTGFLMKGDLVVGKYKFCNE